MTKLASFRALGLSESVLRALDAKGFEEPTKIQSQVIPLLLKNEVDVVGQAQTGTGKTAAFGLPIIENIKPNKGHVQAIIITPTRELAIQVAEEIISLRGENHLSAVPIYGGQSMEQQIRALRRGVDIVVGTPGRILDLIRRKVLKIDKVSYAVLDEADEMLKMGFQEDMEQILAETPKEKRMLLFSATMPPNILNLAKKYMGKFEFIQVQKKMDDIALVDQIYFEVRQSNKFEALCRIIDTEPDFYGLIFTRTRRDADDVAQHLGERGYDTEALHGDIAQKTREKILNKFKKQAINILVATDVAARGIDVNNLSHVVNYSLPADPESYVHRIGRTGRAGKKGVAITFITPNEFRSLNLLQRTTKTNIRREELPELADVAKIKKIRLLEKTAELLELTPPIEYQKLANEVLKSHTPEHIVATLLFSTFQTDLSAKATERIKGPQEAADSQAPRRENKSDLLTKDGKMRLYFAFGQIDDTTEDTFRNLIKENVKISGDLEDIRITERFSLATVSAADGQKILDAFKEEKRGTKPLVKIDGSDSGFGGRPRSGGFSRDRGGRGGFSSDRPRSGGFSDSRPDRPRSGGFSSDRGRSGSGFSRGGSGGGGRSGFSPRSGGRPSGGRGR